MISHGPRLILVGPPGSGKSTVGRLAAERLGVPFHDFDDDLHQSQGSEAGELVVHLGRERFQQVEFELLATVLPDRPGVLALGGGTPTAPGVPELLKPFLVAFLDVELKYLLQRKGLVSLHPWLIPNPRAQLRQLLAERKPIYTAVANVVVSTSGLEPSAVVDELLESL